ncbi:MAG: transcriptional regulator [Frankiales bacterium]|nr:transcriptional regulator [Frankiales bacterium]
MPGSTGSPPTRRVVEVLQLLAAGEPLTASGVAQRLGLSGSTCAVLLAELGDAGFVARADDKRYRLGVGLVPLVREVRRRFPLLGAADEVLDRLHTRTGLGCSLTRIDPDGLTVVAVAGPGRPGARFPLDPPYGVVAHAYRSAADIDQWTASLDRAARTRYRAVLAGIRERGYTAWGLESAAAPLVGEMRQLLTSLADHPASGELRGHLVAVFARLGGQGWTPRELDAGGELSLSYLLAPVLGDDGRPAYQVELHVLRERVSAAERERLVEQVRQAAAALTVS